MKYLLTIILLLPLLCSAQGGTSASTSQTVSGEVVIPALQSVRIEMLDPGQVNFTTPQDFMSPRIIPAFCNVTVTSTVPWIVNVSLGGAGINATGTGVRGDNLPSGTIELKGNTGAYVPLSIRPTPLLRSTNTLLQNSFLIAMKINPSIGFASGHYNADILFTITPE
jgi:hypothetical protein